MTWSRIGFAVVVIAITIGSLLPGSSVGAVGELPDWVRHGFGYLVLGFFSRLAFRSVRQWIIFIGVFTYGAVIEVLQPIISDRNFEVTDMLANAVGAALGIILATLTTYRFRSPRQ